MFDPLDLLVLAKSIDRDTEAGRRTIISRAYYAVFLLARERLKIKTVGPGVHKAVVERLYQYQLLDIARKMHQLRTFRNLSDYNLQANIGLKEVHTSLQLADAILKFI